jgi:uncharacterized protein YndB with AHSA1/START domain
MLDMRRAFRDSDRKIWRWRRFIESAYRKGEEVAMFEIMHEFWIRADREKVFDACATTEGLEAWWTLRTSGGPRLNEEYKFYFSEAHDWRGVARVCQPPRAIEWEMTNADEDWTHTRVGFELEPEGEGTRLLFRHSGWRDANRHFRVSSYCWATYLRLLKRYVERGEVVAYADRDEA